MSVYPKEVNRRFLSPEFTGRADGCSSVGTSASFECGSFVRMSLAIDFSSRAIKDARFQSNGCGYMIAAADKIAENLIGRELTDLHSVGEMEFIRTIEFELGDIPKHRIQCLHVVLEALRAALADYRAYLIEEFRGEKPLICTCFGVSEETIDAFILANLPDSVEQVTEACRAGSGCGSCRMLIQEMIDAQTRETSG